MSKAYYSDSFSKVNSLLSKLERDNKIYKFISDNTDRLITKVSKYLNMKTRTKVLKERKRKGLNKNLPLLKQRVQDLKNIDIFTSKKISTIKQLRDESDNGFKRKVYEKMRPKRIIKQANQHITQNPIFDIDSKILLGKDDYDEIVNDKYNLYIHLNIGSIVEDYNKELYDNTSNVINAGIQLMYVTFEEIQKHTGVIDDGLEIIEYTYRPLIWFTRSIKRVKGVDTQAELKPYGKNFKYDPKNFLVQLKDSITKFLFVGYQIVYATRKDKDLNPQTLYALKAFHPTNNIKFHKLSKASTSNYKICIYESYMHTTGKINLLYMKDNQKKLLMDDLKKEDGGKDKYIYDAVINGELINALELLTKKYDNEVNIVYFNNGAFCDYDDDGKLNMNDRPVNINRGVMRVLEDDDEV